MIKKISWKRFKPILKGNNYGDTVKYTGYFLFGLVPIYINRKKFSFQKAIIMSTK